MFGVEPVLGILAAAIVLLIALAALLTAALMGRGPLYGRFLEIDRTPKGPQIEDDDGPPEVRAPLTAVAVQTGTRLLVRDRLPGARADALARRGLRPSEDELNEVLRGTFAIDTYNRAVRVVAWSFILVVLLIVAVSQLWRPVEPQIFVTLILAGAFVLVVHELLPPGSLGTGRIVMEGSAAIIFLTMLVLLTGHSLSPFFFLYPLLIGGAALIAPPKITVILTLETAVAYTIAAVSGPMDSTGYEDALTRVAINLTALLLLAYSGVVVSRVQSRTREAAIRLSTVDSLTDLYNRAFFFNAVDHEIQRAKRYRRGFCLLMMDLDGLKSINDRYGHYEGDVVLCGVAQLIRAGLRGNDIAARYGGDEFVAMLPETDQDGAYVVAEKIRQTAAEMVVEAGGHQISTSLSIGVVSYPEDGQTADELMIAADEAMYSSKRLGKNRVVGYTSTGESSDPPAAPYRSPVSTPGFRPLQREGEGWGPHNGERR
ncbi:MAG: diguanylate cyclase [Candidatus Limnocylindrales bacterium]|jgi:diguanylate cyclase (GGDEF)-like protein